MTLNAFDVAATERSATTRADNFGKELGIDGMTVDREGHIYAAVRSASRFGIVVFSPAGKELAYVETPVLPTNCVFGRGDQNRTLISPPAAACIAFG